MSVPIKWTGVFDESEWSRISQHLYLPGEDLDADHSSHAKLALQGAMDYATLPYKKENLYHFDDNLRRCELQRAIILTDRLLKFLVGADGKIKSSIQEAISASHDDLLELLRVKETHDLRESVPKIIDSLKAFRLDLNKSFSDIERNLINMNYSQPRGLRAYQLHCRNYLIWRAKQVFVLNNFHVMRTKHFPTAQKNDLPSPHRPSLFMYEVLKTRHQYVETGEFKWATAMKWVNKVK